MLRTRVVLLAIVLVIANAGVSNAQFAPVSTYAFQHLMFPTGARSIALGQVGAADDADPLNQFYNPAILTTYDGVGVSYSTVDLWVNLSLSEISAQVGHEFAVDNDVGIRVAGSLRYVEFDMEPQPERTIFLPGGVGADYSGDSHLAFTFVAGVGNQVVDAGIGLAAKYIEGGVSSDPVNGWAYDVGIFVKMLGETESGWVIAPSLGFSALNLGSDIDYGDREAKLPDEARFGLKLAVHAPASELLWRVASPVELAFVADAINGERADRLFGFGAELGLIELLYARFGYLAYDDRNPESVTSQGVGIALPFRDFRFTFDYSHYDPQNFSGEEVDAYAVAASYRF